GSVTEVPGIGPSRPAPPPPRILIPTDPATMRNRPSTAGAAQAQAPDVALTCFVLVGNTLLRPLVNAINRAPIKESGTEAIYEVRLSVPTDRLDEGRELLETLLGEASYPFREIEATERDDETVELLATLVGTPADPDKLD